MDLDFPHYGGFNRITRMPPEPRVTQFQQLV